MLNQIETAFDKVFPEGKWQERMQHYLSFELQMEDSYLNKVYLGIRPLENGALLINQ